MKKKKISKIGIYYIISVFLIIVALIFTIYFSITAFKNNNDNNNQSIKEPVDHLHLYGYSLNDRDTDYFKTNFKLLKKVLNSDDVNLEEYSNILAKLFISDLYTLDNKVSSTDIGGVQFVFPSFVLNFEQNMGDNMYHHIVTDLDGKRDQKLPIVSDVRVLSNIETTYTYDEKNYKAREVKVEWSYIEEMGYENNATIIMIFDNNKWHVVEKLK